MRCSWRRRSASPWCWLPLEHGSAWPPDSSCTSVEAGVNSGDACRANEPWLEYFKHLCAGTPPPPQKFLECRLSSPGCCFPPLASFIHLFIHSFVHCKGAFNRLINLLSIDLCNQLIYKQQFFLRTKISQWKWCWGSIVTHFDIREQ